MHSGSNAGLQFSIADGEDCQEVFKQAFLPQTWLRSLVMQETTDGDGFD